MPGFAYAAMFMSEGAEQTPTGVADRIDRRMLDLAARAGWRGFGRVEPNPMVGCVLVRHSAGKEPVVVGIGHHRRFGDLHAERDALADCARRGEPGAAKGAIAYVTLEPCNGHGKQPPCVEALVQAGVAEVVYAEVDPSKNKRGGAEALTSVGIPARRSGASVWASRLSAPWRKQMATGLPWVIVKWAQSIDGRVATGTGDSKWISSEASRRWVHTLRGRVDVVLTGIGTVLADDPVLDCRHGIARRCAVRVVADSVFQVSPASALLRSIGEAGQAKRAGGRVIVAGRSCFDPVVKARIETIRSAGAEVWCDDVDGASTQPGRAGPLGLDLERVLRRLAAPAQQGGVGGCDAQTVLVEAGPRLVGSLMRAGLVDEIVTFTAPFVLPDTRARSASAPSDQASPLDTIAAGRSIGLYRTGLVRPVSGSQDVLCTWWRDPPSQLL